MPHQQLVIQSDGRCHGLNGEAFWRDNELFYWHDGRLVKSLPYLPYQHLKTIGLLRQRGDKYRWKNTFRPR
jgi:hypothetical protein